MADAKTLSDADNGVDANGKPLPWRVVHLLRDAKVGDLNTGDTAEDANTSTSEYDHIATLAKILTRRYKGHDVFDLLALAYDALYETVETKETK